MKLTDEQRSTLSRAETLERRFDSGIFPTGSGQHAHFRKLERMGLLAFDGWGRDIDGEVERDVACFRLTDAGRAALLSASQAGGGK